MPALTLAVGVALTLLGVVGYLASSAASLTALIPALFGVLLSICWVAARNGRFRRHAMHAAAAIALLGVLGSLPNVLRTGQLLDGTAARPLAVVVSAAMCLVLLGYLVAAVRSFLRARRVRTVG